MTDAPTGYATSPSAKHLPIAKVERALLCDLFDEVGPHRQTLCEGWTTHHLAAHMKIREGNPVDFFRNAMPGDKIVDQMVESEDYTELVRSLRRGPSILSIFAIPKAGDAINTLEYFIHHEDVRRGEGNWEPRESADLGRGCASGGRSSSTAKLSMLRNPRQLTLRRSRHRRRRPSVQGLWVACRHRTSRRAGALHVRTQGGRPRRSARD